MCTINDKVTILDLEIYTNNFTRKHYNKSYAYMCRLFDLNIENTRNYNSKNIISLNLMSGNYRRINPRLVNEHRIKNDANLNSDDGNTIMYLSKKE